MRTKILRYPVNGNIIVLEILYHRHRASLGITKQTSFASLCLLKGVRGFIDDIIIVTDTDTDTHKYALTGRERERERGYNRKMMNASIPIRCSSNNVERRNGFVGMNTFKKEIKMRRCSRGQLRAQKEEEARKSLDALERELELNVTLENYAEAAKIRDRVNAMRESDYFLVELQNAMFYDAFRKGSFQQMKAVWGRGEHVRCTHPGMPCVLGDLNVLESWKIVFESMGSGGGGLDVECKNANVYAQGTFGMVTCEEIVMKNGRLTCTNVFEKQDGKWLMIQHHASAVALPQTSEFRSRQF